MSSLWKHLDASLTDDGGRSIARFRRGDRGFDLGSIIAATRNDLPFMERSKLAPDITLGSGTTFQVNRELFYHLGWVDDVNPAWYVAVKYVKLANKTEYATQQLLRNVMRVLLLR